MIRTGSDLQSTPRGDRFIPARSASIKDVAHFNLMSENSFDAMDVESSPAKAYKTSLAQTLFNSEETPEDAKILALKNKAPAPRAGYQNHLAVLYSQNLGGKAKKGASSSLPLPSFLSPPVSSQIVLNLNSYLRFSLAFALTPP